MQFSQESIATLELPAGKSDYLVFDDEMPGFGIRLRAGGKRVGERRAGCGNGNGGPERAPRITPWTARNSVSRARVRSAESIAVRAIAR